MRDAVTGFYTRQAAQHNDDAVLIGPDALQQRYFSLGKALDLRMDDRIKVAIADQTMGQPALLQIAADHAQALWPLGRNLQNVVRFNQGQRLVGAHLLHRLAVLEADAGEQGDNRLIALQAST